MKYFDYFTNDPLDVSYLEDEGAVARVAAETASGKILIVDMRGVYGFVYNPFIPDLYDTLALLKGRENNQFFNLAASYEKLLTEVVDKKRVNPDFFHLNETICAKIIVRIPNRELDVEPIGNPSEMTVQSLSFEGIDPLLAKFQKHIQKIGVYFTAGTSGNLHRLPSITDPAAAERFAAALNLTAQANGIDANIIVAHLTRHRSPSKGSYPIFSFLEKNKIEIIRLVNKTDYEETERVKNYLLSHCQLQTPIVYNLKS
jgi:hypothetical protein